ncbi:MAG: lysophospholipid acyltransferase family protein [Pyrinomonadaceae bacterium]
MIRPLIITILRFALRIYFQRIEVTGVENVPLKAPVIFVLNHPNALVDPVFLLCLAPRRVSFLAKAPLFRMPVLGYFVRAMDSLPIYRRQDEGEDISKNQETFVAARRLLARGGTIGICPEGVSHDAPGLKPIKTGAARISLAARSAGDVTELWIVPAGLYYTSKTSFRSSALLYFGKGIRVEPAELDSDGDPPRLAVRELSTTIEKSLRDVVLDAQHDEALHTISRAERIFSSDENENGDETLADELRLQQRFIKAYSVLKKDEPERVRRLVIRMRRFEEELTQAGIDPEDLSAPSSTAAVFSHIATRILWFSFLLAPGIAGTILHFPAYWLGGYLATRLSQDAEDVISTIKIISAMLLFPLTWLFVAIALYPITGWLFATASLLLIPIAGYVAILFFEELDRSVGALRALTFFLLRRRFFVRLLAERKAIKSEIVSLGEIGASAEK